MPKALVTGGAGFIGSNVADLYVAQGFDVTVLDNLSSGRRSNIPAQARFVEADIRSPEAADLVRRERFDIISHLAAQIDVRKSVLDPVNDALINVVGSVNLLEAVRASGAKTRFVFSSTGGAIYGDFVTPPSVEEYAKDPESPYGIAKLSVEYYMAYFARVHGVDTVALRYANVYGPRQDPHGEAGVVAIFCNRILDGRSMTVFGDGAQTRDYVFVGDVARANLAAATRELPAVGKLDARGFNIGTSKETSVNELAETLIRAAGSSVGIEYAPARAGELQRSAVRTDKAQRELGWKAEVSLEDGLRQTFEWFAAHRAAARA